MNAVASPPPRPASAPGAIHPPPPPSGGNGHHTPTPSAVRALSLKDMIREPEDGLDPQIILEIGPPGTGKTSLIKGSPSPVLVMADRGGARSLSKKLYRARIYPNAWDRVTGEAPTVEIMDEDGEKREEPRIYMIDILNDLLTGQHGYRTVLFDTLNRIRDLLHTWICAKNNKAPTMQAVGYAGWDQAAVEWNRMLTMCWDLRDRRRINVVLTSHQEAKKVPNPSGEDSEMWVPCLDKRAIEIWNGGVDTILYLQPASRIVATETGGSKKNPTTRHKVDFDGVIAHTRPAQGMWAKNRDMLPEEIDGISWAILMEEAEKGQRVQEELEDVLSRFPREVRAAAERQLAASNWSREKALDLINKAKQQVQQKAG